MLTFISELKSEMKTNSVLDSGRKSFVNSANPTTSCCSIACNGIKLSQKAKKINLDFHILQKQMRDWLNFNLISLRQTFSVCNHECICPWLSWAGFLKVIWKVIHSLLMKSDNGKSVHTQFWHFSAFLQPVLNLCLSCGEKL